MAAEHLLRAAAQEGDLDRVRARLDAGSDPEGRHKGTGRTALLEAVIAGQAEVVALLVERGADLTASCTAVGHTALQWAVVQGHPDIARVLLAAGAEVDALPKNSFLGRTALHLAAQTGNLELLRLLIDAGADPALIDGRGDNALSLARAGGHEDAAALLLASGAGEPPVGEAVEPIAWPELPWDPISLQPSDSLPDDVEPAQVVASYISALHHWETVAWQRNTRAKEDGSDFDFTDALDEAERLTALHLTDRVRRYRRASIGAIPDLTPAFALIGVTAPSANRAELLVVHPDPQEFVHEYEWTFVCLRRAGRWRIDSARNRLRGTTAWHSVVL